MKRSSPIPFTVALALSACWSNSNSGAVETALNHSMAITDAHAGCGVVGNAMVVGDSYIQNDKNGEGALVFQTLAKNRYATIRASKPDDLAFLGDMFWHPLGDKAAGRHTWILTPTGQRAFPAQTQGSAYRWMCPLSPPTVVRILRDTTNQVNPSLHQVAAEIASNWAPWVTADMKPALTTVAGFHQTKIGETTTRVFSVDETGGTPKVTQ